MYIVRFLNMYLIQLPQYSCHGLLAILVRLFITFKTFNLLPWLSEIISCSVKNGVIQSKYVFKLVNIL